MQKYIMTDVILLMLVGIYALSLNPTAAAETDPTPTPSAYGTLLDTEIRGLSPDTIEVYRTGAGGGLALPAELNGYPGPLHVLGLAEELELTEEQQTEVQALYDAMLPEAVRVGEAILEAEATLERAFREMTIDEPTLQAQLVEIGELQSELRFIHLRSHLTTTALLTPEQIEQYNTLRGYVSAEQSSHSQHGQHGNH